MARLPAFPVLAVISCVLSPLLASCVHEESAAAGPPAARVEIVEDTYFGVSVPDPYRWMEAMEDAEFQDYLRAQNAYARGVLDRLAARRELLTRVRELQAGTSQIRFVQRAGDRFFFLETPANSVNARLVQRRVDSERKHVLVEPGQFDVDGRKASIDFIGTSPDGSHVAFVVSHAGAEDWTLRIVETATSKLLDDVVPMIANPIPRWSADGSGFYYSRLQDMAPGIPEEQRYDNVRVYFHALGTEAKRDRAIFGAGVSPELDMPARSVFPDVIPSSDGRYLVATLAKGTDYNARAMWIRELQGEKPQWRKVADYADLVSAVEPHADALHVISSRNAPNGEVLRFDPINETIADARVTVPAGDVIVSADNGMLGATRRALYVMGQRNGYGIVRRVGLEKFDITELVMPSSGVIVEFTTDNTADHMCFGLQSPVLSSQVFCRDPRKGEITNTELTERDPADYSEITVRHAEVSSTDGVRVPLTIIGPKNVKFDGTNPVLLTVYGSYGVIVPMWYIGPNLAWYERGGFIVFAHTRGGGEKGVAWHHAARRTGRQKTIDDTLAAAQWLIEEGYTSPRHLAIAGKSAGGLPTGAAITQRPELFRAALFRVGVTDMLRIEQTAGGPANAQEYGSVTIEDEFRVLHAVSPYANVRDGVEYPAVMLETGVNDRRVPPWQLAKMAARLQAATSSDQPVLLRVDYASGHGLGSDKLQVAELLADEYAFLGWQLGMKGFEPADRSRIANGGQQ